MSDKKRARYVPGPGAEGGRYSQIGMAGRWAEELPESARAPGAMGPGSWGGIARDTRSIPTPAADRSTWAPAPAETDTNPFSTWGSAANCDHVWTPAARVSRDGPDGHSTVEAVIYWRCQFCLDGRETPE